MATVPVMSTVSAGGIGTAALWNSQVRDTGNFFLNTPHAILRETAAQSIATSTDVAVTFSIEDADTDSGHSTVSNTSRYTAVTAGTFKVDCSGAVVANATGRVELHIRTNGTTDLCQTSQNNSAATAAHLAIGTEVFLNVGDYIEMILWQNSGGALNTSIAKGNPRMAVRWMGT